MSSTYYIYTEPGANGGARAPRAPPLATPLSSRLIAADVVESLVLVKQCRLLEADYGSNYTSDVISNPDMVSFTQMNKEILDEDVSLLLSESETHSSQHCNAALLPPLTAAGPDLGPCSGERCLWHSLAILWLFSLHVFSDNNCPFSGSSQTITNSEIVAHFLSSHTALNFTAKQCVESLKSRSESIFNYGKDLNQVFRTLTWN